MELKDLIGKHELDAVDFSTESIDDGFGYKEDSQVCRFRLDGIVYVASEDPDDGFRSCMRDLEIDESAIIKNEFNKIEVVGKYINESDYGDESDILVLIDVNTGEAVLEVGTKNTNDYYPYYVANFHPEAMSINK